MRVAPVVGGQPVPADGLQASADAVCFAFRLVSPPTASLPTPSLGAAAQTVPGPPGHADQARPRARLSRLGGWGLWGLGG